VCRYPLPCEIYCHSLADPSILSDSLRESGAQTLTVFGLHTPHKPDRRIRSDRMRDTLTSAVLKSLIPFSQNQFRRADGRLGGAALHRGQTTLDLERTLA